MLKPNRILDIHLVHWTEQIPVEFKCGGHVIHLASCNCASSSCGFSNAAIQQSLLHPLGQAPANAEAGTAQPISQPLWADPCCPRMPSAYGILASFPSTLQPKRSRSNKQTNKQTFIKTYLEPVRISINYFLKICLSYQPPLKTIV